jgi:hypothetical protein
MSTDPALRVKTGITIGIFLLGVAPLSALTNGVAIFRAWRRKKQTGVWLIPSTPPVGPVFCIMALVVAPFQNWLLAWNATVFILDPGGMTYLLTGLKMYLKERKNM